MIQEVKKPQAAQPCKFDQADFNLKKGLNLDLLPEYQNFSAVQDNPSMMANVKNTTRSQLPDPELAGNIFTMPFKGNVREDVDDLVEIYRKTIKFFDLELGLLGIDVNVKDLQRFLLDFHKLEEIGLNKLRLFLAPYDKAYEKKELKVVISKGEKSEGIPKSNGFISLFQKLNPAHKEQICVPSFVLDLKSFRTPEETWTTFAVDILHKIKVQKSFEAQLACTGLTNKGLSALRSNVNVSDVDSFILNINSTFIDDEGVEKLGNKLLSKLQALERLELHLANIMVKNKGLNALNDCPSPKLNRLVLDVSGLDICEWDTEKFTRSFLSTKKKLEDVKLLLDSSRGTAKKVRPMFEYLFQNVKCLTIDASKTDACDQDFPFCEKTVLKHLELRLWGTKITDQSLSQLFVLSMPSIRTLVLDLRNTEITDVSITMLLRTYLCNVKGIEHLELYLADTQVSEESLMYFGELSGKMTYIKTLVLDLSETKVSDLSIKALSSLILPCCVYLERLELNLKKTSVTDAALSNLFGQKLQALKRLVLQLGNTNVTDETVNSLLRNRPLVERLEHLEMHLYMTKVSKEKKNEIEQLQNKINSKKQFI